MQELPSLPEAPPTSREFTQSELATYDFTGWDWKALPRDLIKSAKNGSNFTIVAKVECVECKRPMWTCDPKREDMCEEDEYLIRSRNWDLRAERAKRNNMKPVNPWAENEDPIRAFWPLDKA